MKNFKVAFASNDGYAEHLAVAIYSLLKNLSNDYFAEIIVLDGGISEKNKNLIKKICKEFGKGNAKFIIMDRKKFEKLPTTRLSQEIYYRLDLPDLLQNDKKIIYLDVDIIVNGDISQLINIDLENNIIGAVREITTMNYYIDDYNLTSKNGGLFFNSGILLMDLEKMRKFKFKEKFYDGMDKFIKIITFHDQDILNIILENNRLSLHPKFNALPFLWTTNNWKILGYTKSEFYEAKNNPVIVHYASKKPWNNTCSHPLEYLYHQYRKEIGLKPIVKKRLTIKSLFEKCYSQFGLFLISNMPHKLFKVLIYKPHKWFLKKVKYSNYSIKQKINFLIKRYMRIFLGDCWNKFEFIARLAKSGRILDVGCGNNSPKITKMIKPSIYYVGVDIGDYNQEKGSIEAADEYLISTPEAFPKTIASAKGNFDAVISAHNIEHCNAPFETLGAMCSKVKKGGLLFMAFPSEKSITFPSRKGTLNFYDDKTHIYLPEFEKILKTIQESGFKIVFKSPSYRPLGMRLIGMIVDRIVKSHVNRFTRAHYGFEAIIWAKKI